MATAVSARSDASSRSHFACIRCAERKVKCDRLQPCSACTKHNKECIFNPSKPPRKRIRRVKVQSLVEQLSFYEGLLLKNGIISTNVPNTTCTNGQFTQSDTSRLTVLQPQTPVSLEELPGGDISGATSSHGDVPFTYVENNLWRRVVDESHNPDKSVDHFDTSSEESDDDQGFVLSSRIKPSNRPCHPPPDTMHKLWEIFEENVDPLTKIVHVPTLRPAVQKALVDTSTIPRSFEALLFAIYGAAIMSLKDAECQRRFSEPRRSLLSRYTSATGKALSRAKFMETTSLVVLQALVIHLLSVRDVYAPRAVWSLTGVAVRIAQTMGLERDGTFLGLSPFETELRRRIWWQLKLHDFRTAELCGLAKFRDLDMGVESPRWPTNLDDDQLHPGMTSLVDESDKVTDILFVAFRCEMTNFAASRVAEFRKQGKDPSMWALHTQDQSAKARAFIELQDTLETKYLRYCDPSRPLHLLTMLVGRYGMNVVKFLTNHPRKWISLDQTPPEERKLVWDVSIKLLEQHDMVQSTPMLQPFAWHATYFQQWHAFIHVLDILRTDPLNSDAAKAWKLVGNTYENTPAMILDMKKPLHIAVAKLCLKAYGAREVAMQTASLNPGPTPAFIIRLRQRWETIKAKQRAQNAKSLDVEHSSQSQGTVLDESNSVFIAITSRNAPIVNVPDRGIAPQMENLGPAVSHMQNNPFDFFTGLNDPQYGAGDTGFEFPSTEDSNVDGFDMTTVDWEQWDAWLADSNVMRPYPA